MREIKFRAWDLYDKRMIDIGDLEAIFTADRDLDFANYEIMQYAGLPDRNDVEIYENDIVKTLTGKIYVVLWREHMGAWSLQAENSQKRLGDIHFKLEVIGNIYENSSLFEKPTNQ